MRVFLQYLLPVILLLTALYALDRRRHDDKQSHDEESANASAFLKILALGGCIAIALLLIFQLG